ncbi:bifunctional 2-polyprenyl-6-hydroxyphenol methylase/3-demethylubiquinol 3-O-methyltransferase UbiG [Pseudoruegeria sp. HB172150]|uniref:class I SAM-dependent methyltransferase n=1 Tax=Pseudoruegeria sp. HB172150 TaxID=2721164 RepID=UPI0015556B1E|nr:methyltransferase domain-containing protein [Pseudoruegeria sp. HB172150]
MTEAAQIRRLKRQIRALRCAPSPMVPLAGLARQRCIACGGTDLSVCRYPAYQSRFFAGLILAQCGACGLAWVPLPGLDLDDYYTNHYADEFRVERAYDGAFYGPENPIWSKPEHKGRDRARGHAADLARFGPFSRVLDLGAGEGLFLHAVEAAEKYAVEPDAYSVRILRDELGVTVQDLDARRDFFDLVMSSHSLEHFTYDRLGGVLAGVLAALRPGGLFHVEVPAGAAQLERFVSGERGTRQRLEPHTLFFSSHALALVLARAGFELVESAVCPWTETHIGADLPAPAVRRAGPALIVIARRPD